MSSPLEDRHPNILVTGTPGVGKSSVCREVAEYTGMKYIELSRAIEDNKLYREWDDEMNCSIFDEDLVTDYLEDFLIPGNVIVDFHGCDFLDPLLFDAAFILRTENGILYKRLEQRSYSVEKIQQNIECEIFQVILDEAFETFPEDKIFELQNDTIEQLQENISTIKQSIESVLALNEKRKAEESNA
ncbi:TAF9 Rna polymerase II, TATA box binding protein (TBP)-associated factor isoform 2 family protein [Cardiosporidium cionae]|uniref:Adenylate kinase isoenzyme 6 homolog n=1 Tax=Cardiosporidium cionae TaxID=476202 RepID=A0ABQ7J4R9_9APIC|nr:TAF9 Rna polymerase II, TATA box binding protein (TBP)-associated factor isoform 2 family protein [Cardiosporidium cionae]|eukprot:KAF8818523.1 TAF9 Rna polymerase II, TATA box binding protein (TBP)-associated factor isoform 2 family protein [Cardiosporidium cionae]